MCMPRYFVWASVFPVVLPEGDRRFLAVRTIRAATPREAADQGLLRIRRELLADLGAGPLQSATYELYKLEELAWSNFRRINTNFVLTE